MLSEHDILAYARGLVAEVNGEFRAPTPPDLPEAARALYEYENRVREWAEKTLRRIAKVQRPDSPDWRRGVQWRLREQRLMAFRRRTRRELFATCVELMAQDDEMAGREIELPTFEVRLEDLVYGEDGRLSLTQPPHMSRPVRVAVTIAELLSADCPVQVLVCPLESCRRLFVRELRQRGRPQLFCCRAHATTHRSHKHRPIKLRRNARRIIRSVIRATHPG